MNEPTIGEVLEFLQENVPTKEDLKVFATKDDLKGVLKDYPTKDDLKEALKDYPTRNDLRYELGKLKIEVGQMMDEKLTDLEGTLIVLARKEDKKLIQLVEIMKKKALLTEAEAKAIFSMEPFPQTII